MGTKRFEIVVPDQMIVKSGIYLNSVLTTPERLLDILKVGACKIQPELVRNPDGSSIDRVFFPEQDIDKISVTEIEKGGGHGERNG